jgi:hypothetical protein
MEQTYLTRARAALARRATKYEESSDAATPAVTAPAKETKEVRTAGPDPYFEARKPMSVVRWVLRVRLARIAAAYDLLPSEQRPDLAAPEWRGLMKAVDEAARAADTAALTAVCDALDRRIGLPPWEEEQAADEWADLRALLAGGLLTYRGPLTLSTGAQLRDVAGCCRVWLEELRWPPQRRNAGRQLRALRVALGGPSVSAE